MKKLKANAQKKQRTFSFLVIWCHPFLMLLFLNLAGYVHQRTEIIMKLYQKVVLNLCVIYLFIYLILILQLHAFIPKILLVILLTVLPSILIILVWTVWCWINLWSLNWCFSLFSSLVCLILYWWCREIFCLRHSIWSKKVN